MRGSYRFWQAARAASNVACATWAICWTWLIYDSVTHLFRVMNATPTGNLALNAVRRPEISTAPLLDQLGTPRPVVIVAVFPVAATVGIAVLVAAGLTVAGAAIWARDGWRVVFGNRPPATSEGETCV